MTRRILLTAAVLAATAIGSTAIAESNHGHGGQPGSNDRADMMMKDGSGMMGNMGDMSNMMGMMQRMHGQMMGGGMMGGMHPMGGGMMQMFDADGDGTVTPEEMRAGLQAKLTEYDSDGDGALSIEEFEMLHSAMFREMMVDRFQHLDADGDGAVTAEEMMAPANKLERMQQMREGMGQMQPGDGQGMGNGEMMNDN
ncbi:calcium-binding protein [Aliiroseovarius sp. S1339]|uniref:EF-hand domain-containing protein n=1 Tax=Aliiroseovarius sp. S1339 TaxID=2936990 RepID=UPI0020BF6FE9|nr:calcium-binding protein [Aliiroseovarius sp. S1339]MCK8463100.1 calcium-binding protein [Aliiroseovarius sp. S1339]